MNSRRSVGAASAPLALPTLLGFTHSASAQAFAKNGGPTSSGALSSLSSDSIEITFSLDTNTGGCQKLIDFKNLSSDNGLYNLNGSPNFYNDVTSPTQTFSPGVPADVLFTRDGPSDVFTGYVDGVPQIKYTDTAGDAVFATNDIHLFQDDTVTGQNEAGHGVLYSVRVNDSVIIAPEPSAVVALACGGGVALGLILTARKRNGAA